MNRQAWQAVVGDYRGEVQEQIDCSSYGEACELIGDIAQRKLLEYQIKTVESNLGGNLQIAVTTWLESMLKQLETK